MKPTVGRIVHLTRMHQCIAAIVTDVVGTEDMIHVTVFAPHTTPYPQRTVTPGSKDDNWHWPERE